jgi:hypothetical protein
MVNECQEMPLNPQIDRWIDNTQKGQSKDEGDGKQGGILQLVGHNIAQPDCGQWEEA